MEINGGTLLSLHTVSTCHQATDCIFFDLLSFVSLLVNDVFAITLTSNPSYRPHTSAYLRSLAATKPNSSRLLCLSGVDGCFSRHLAEESSCVRTRCRGAFRKHRPPQAVNRGQGQIPGCQMWRCGSGAVVVPVAGCTS